MTCARLHLVWIHIYKDINKPTLVATIKSLELSHFSRSHPCICIYAMVAKGATRRHCNDEDVSNSFMVRSPGERVRTRVCVEPIENVCICLHSRGSSIIKLYCRRNIYPRARLCTCFFQSPGLNVIFF